MAKAVTAAKWAEARELDAQDGRGRWRHRDACAVSLATDGSAATAIACAAAAERLGAWLRGAHARALREIAA